MLSKESDTTNGEGSFCPFVLTDSQYPIPPDSAAAETVSKDVSFLRQYLNRRKDQRVSYVVTSIM